MTKHAAAEGAQSTYEQFGRFADTAPEPMVDDFDSNVVQEFADRYKALLAEEQQRKIIVDSEVAKEQEQGRIDAEFARNRWGIFSRVHHKVKDFGGSVADKVRITIPTDYMGDLGRPSEPIPLTFGQTIRAKMIGGVGLLDLRPSDPYSSNPVIDKAYRTGIAKQDNAVLQYRNRVAGKPQVDPRQFAPRRAEQREQVERTLFERIVGATAVGSELP